VKSLVAALYRSRDEALKKRAAKISACRKAWLFMATDAGDGRVTPNRCDDRACPYCAGHRARTIRPVIEAILEAGGRHIVLSVAHEKDETWLEVRDRLLRAWKFWWRDPVVRVYVGGGVRKVETTWSPDHGWHVHIHALVVGQYFPYELLNESWKRATGQEVVACRIGKCPKVTEFLSYALKAPSLEVPDALLWEWAVSSQGKRDFQRFGKIYGVKEDEVGEGEEEEEEERWYPVCPARVAAQAAAGDQWALSVVASWSRDWTTAYAITRSAEARTRAGIEARTHRTRARARGKEAG
jgi:hypothetical protein